MEHTTSPASGELRLAWCGRCARHSFPATVYGCGQCGAEAATLVAVPLPHAPRLLNFVTVHAELAPGLPVPCVVGEVQLAPGLVEEALIDAAEDALRPGMSLQPCAVPGVEGLGWRFAPAGDAA